jgi:uncharacterized integral membrane protein
MLAHRDHVLSEAFFGPAPTPAWLGVLLVAVGGALIWIGSGAPRVVLEFGGLVIFGAVLVGARIGLARDEVRRLHRRQR